MSTALRTIRRNNVTPFFGDRLFDSVFDSFFDNTFGIRSASGYSPNYNVALDEGGYNISVAIPGLDKGDIDINVESNTLTISYKQEEGSNNSFACSSFSRHWRLPEGTETDNITASYDKGILTLSVPTADASISSRKIEIQ